MALNNTSSDSDDEIGKSRAMIFPHEKPLHEILGGGKGTPLFHLCHFLLYFIYYLIWTCNKIVPTNKYSMKENES